MADHEKRELEQIVRQVDPSFIATLTKQQREKLFEMIPVVTSTISQRTTSFSGPIPPADMLAEYNQVVQDGAERIFRMTEAQGEHRRRLEDLVVRSQNKQSERGQWMAFWLSIILMAIGTVCALQGKETVSSVIFGTTVVGLSTVFVVGKYLQKVDLANKAKNS